MNFNTLEKNKSFFGAPKTKRFFWEKVWELTKKIPKGKVSTYKELAKSLGTKAYRAVGNALNKNPHAPIVPCHRVVKTDGTIGGFASGSEKKKKLLKVEGVKFEGNRIIDFDKVFFKLL
ncbi:MAG: MGMT family protein [Nanoarchaeota archaeon]|nr:MGMT family protein [Nanoarchaeota archaeon]